MVGTSRRRPHYSRLSPAPGRDLRSSIRFQWEWRHRNITSRNLRPAQRAKTPFAAVNTGEWTPGPSSFIYISKYPFNVKFFVASRAIPHFFPRRKKWGKKDAPVKSRFPLRAARLRETQDSLCSNMLRFSFRERLPARGFSTGKAPPPHPLHQHFPIFRGNRETESEFRGRGGKDIQKNLSLHGFYVTYLLVSP